MLGHLHRVGVEAFPDSGVHAPGGGELHHLLIAPLEGAVPLPQVDHVAVLVTQHLDLNVLGLHQVLLNKDVVVAKGLLGLALHQLKGGADLLGHVAPAHPAAAAAPGRLEDDGEAVLNGLLQGLVGVPQGLGRAGDGGHPAGVGDGFGGELVSHLVQHVGGGADEGDPGLLTGPGEVGVFAQKAVAGVDGVHVAALGQVDDGGNIQVGPQGALVLADEVGLVGPGAEEAVGVLVGVHGHRVQPQVVAGPENADGNLAPVGGQHLVEFALCHWIHPFRSAAACSGHGCPAAGQARSAAAPTVCHGYDYTCPTEILQLISSKIAFLLNQWVIPLAGDDPMQERSPGGRDRRRDANMAETTPNYGLHQWTVRDGIRREELNEDLAKIDEALAEKAESSAVNSELSELESRLQTLQMTLAVRLQVVYGDYTGDGSASRTILLSKKPMIVLVESENGKRSGSGSGAYGGMATQLVTCGCGDQMIVEVISGGFRVFQKTGYAETNATGMVYRYLVAY